MTTQQQETGVTIYQPNMTITELRQVSMDFAKQEWSARCRASFYKR